ncbi:hypothetical protein CPC16_004327 [Podila verticillata]|nr:hypothetical protein CPC16_004327 [Podila verticillata]
MGEYDRAMASYEAALRHSYHPVTALNQIAELYRSRENFPKAAEYFQRILAIENSSGEVWGSLGHCYLMMDELQKAYNAYQNALHHLPNPKDSKLWYGIGILYDRYGSVDHAEEAFSAVMRMDPKYEKANEIYFRLGIIYKGQQKYAQSLECFRYILHTPPRPLTEADIWFQIGHVHEQQKEYTNAKEAYERVLTDNPNHAKVLQQLGWLYHQQNASFMNQDLAIKFLERSIASDNTDAQSWYLMGRCYMAQQKFNKAYEAYQQAVYRDSRNPTFWCSIGLLYFQINQYRDALDAYSKAIRINPNISEVWYDLGTLYESCNNQISDAIDAYQRASDLDPDNPHIKQRLAYLRQNTGGPSGIPPPEEMNPGAYPQGGSNGQNPFGQRSTVAPQGPPTGMQGYTGRQQGPPVPLAQTPMNGDHQQHGRDLPLPMAGGDGNPSGLHPGGQENPGSFMNEERPHIPSLNSGGPRPPTPSVPMPQMMTDRAMGGPPPTSSAGHPPRPAHRPSPGPEGQYARAMSPSMPHHPSNRPAHVDPGYTQHPYGHGPPPPNMMHDGPQYDHQEDPRMKQEHPGYQHHRHRSSDAARTEEDRHQGMEGPMRHHHPDAHSHPHAHAPSPPRDDRRNPQGHPQNSRWVSPSQHGRQPSDDKTHETHRGQHPGGPVPPYPQGPPSHHPHRESEPDRDRPMDQHHNPAYRPGPGGPESQGVFRGPPPTHEHDAGLARGGQAPPPEHERNWRSQEGPKFRAEDQDQDEIAASLVSLGKGPSSRASNSRAHDDDYDMEEAEAPKDFRVNNNNNSNNQDMERSPQQQQQQQQQHQQQQQQQQQQQPSSERTPYLEGYHGESQEPSRPNSQSQAQAPLQAPSNHGETSRQATPKRDEENHRPPSPGPSALSRLAAAAADSSTPNESSEAPTESYENESLASREAPVSSGSTSGVSPNPPSTSSAPPEASPIEDDTEMEEGEVREDDEVMSSGEAPIAKPNDDEK